MAALLWSCIGLMLMWRGGRAIFAAERESLLVISFMIGTFKSWAILDRVALKNIGRIVEKGEYSCLGGVYSWKTWLLVAAMIFLGRLLRASSLQAWLVGLIYVTVGWSLFWSSRKGWQRLRRLSDRPVAGLNGEHGNGEL